ncbi:protein arginine N-methyltransferase 1 [Drosophila willistoni]|uniref:protein arginine N-methyltransferase 1 n=1 Tax=Drosophila willistoni TaxID=7260 RepID=UPI00017D8182|nr:protein arginine N-methyltransferase 1 [Drosophila willistoni]
MYYRFKQYKNRKQNGEIQEATNTATKIAVDFALQTPPARKVPKELELVDRMTSADFRNDHAAHLENMRKVQNDRYNIYFFEKAMEINQHLFKDRVILVLRCGPGTLALMAARIGAKRVYAVDHSNATRYAELVVKENHYENKIKVLNGYISQVQLPEKVDGIVSSWMGQCLLYESSVLEVVEARDRWLKPNGFILPDLASLYMLGSQEQKLKESLCNWWLSVSGFNMNALRQYSLAEPRFLRMQGEKILTMAHRVMSMDLLKINKDEIAIDRQIKLKVKKEGFLECFLFYFDAEFSRSHSPIKLSYNPYLKLPFKSIWHQTVLFIERPLAIRLDKKYVGHLVFRPLKRLNFKQMELHISFFESADNHAEDIYNERLVCKRWLMTDCFQTYAQVASCQDYRALKCQN